MRRMSSRMITIPLHNSDPWTFVTKPHVNNLGAMVICKTKVSLYVSYIYILDVIHSLGSVIM